MNKPKRKTLGEYATVRDAEQMLGVQSSMVHRLERNGLLPPAMRHPANNWRVWKREDLEAACRRIISGTAAPPNTVTTTRDVLLPVLGWLVACELRRMEEEGVASERSRALQATGRAMLQVLQPGKEPEP
jgi:hypothetical protein